MTAIARSHVVRVGLDFNECAAFLQVLNKCLSAFLCGKPGIFPTELVYMTIGCKHTDSGQSGALADFEIVWVMVRRDFYGAGSEVHLDVFIGYDGYFAADDRHYDGFADNVLVTFVVRIYSDARIAEYCFGACCGACNRVRAVRRVIANVPKIALLFCIFDFSVRECRPAYGTAVDYTIAPVDKPFIIEVNKYLCDSSAAAFVHGEALTRPVAG